MSNLSSSAVAPGQTLNIFCPDTLGGVLPLTGASGSVRFLPLTSALSDAGVRLTATATGGAMGVARTAGTSLTLLGEATSASAKTDKALWVTNLPDTYATGAKIVVNAYAAILGTGTLTAASCTLTCAAYSEVNGVEAALTVSAAATIVAAGAVYPFTITGTGLVSGNTVAIELVGLVTSSSGANTLEIGSISFTA